MVKAWKEKVVIPTYEVGQAEKNPIFLEKRVYQGSSGVVYPYPVIEKIADSKTDKEYDAVWIENEYIKVMILPELGGRVQMAYDKLKKRHFVYYNHVVKPALVGLTGPWISGGIEFNWPQHHRPSTYLPVDCRIEENSDGSVTVWVNEMERMFHQKGMAGFTLRPGCAYLEIKGVLYNRTDIPQTFLWWANPAVAVNEHYQSVFPPDINAVFDHGKRAVSTFPIATGTYYKMDYSAGVDISNYKNIKVPTSYMAVNSKYNFEGGYENDTKGGMLHVASNHLSPGKKQWTWGNGDFGRAWDRNLTDDDGPYIELMAGVYTENQPDFTWLMPYEEKRFTQYFMPYRELGIVKNASKDLIMNITEAGGGVNIKVMATRSLKVKAVLRSDSGKELYDNTMELSPEFVFDETVAVGDTRFDELSLLLYVIDGNHTKLNLSWHSEPDDIMPVPDAAEAALLPVDIKTNEQLYLTGLHLEQYRHATYNPVDYYEEALRRDPLDYRCNNALGLWYIRKGRFEKAEGYLRNAVKVIMRRNPNPYDSEPLYNLALALRYQGRYDEAYSLFWKSTWSKAWADAGYFSAAQLSVMQGRYDDALDELERCLDNNSHNHKARALKVSVLRILGRTDEAFRLCDESLSIDNFNYGCMYEKAQIKGDETVLEAMAGIMHGMSNNYDELALDYFQAGLYEDALCIWSLAIKKGAVTPMTYYYMGLASAVMGNSSCVMFFNTAEATCPDYCFPNRLEDIVALQKAMEVCPEASKAPYYLGCLYYDKRQYDVALEMWNKSAVLAPSFPTVWRNLALACFNKENDVEKALEYMEKAFLLDTDDARVFMELDQLYKKLQRPHEERLARMREYGSLVARRDDLLLEEITLLNQTGCYEDAMRMIDNHIFHPWEGGEGKVTLQYQVCRVELAKKAIAGGDYDKAICLLKECLDYPENLGEGKLYGAQENDFYYFLGCAYDGLGDADMAMECWEKAAEGPTEPAAAMYYNDAKPDKIFYQGLALLRLGRGGEANGRFYKLVNFGKNHLFEKQVMDYFAVSLPDLLIWEDSLDIRNRIHCLYMIALGYYGLGDSPRSMRYLNEVEAMDINHQGIQAFATLMYIDNIK
ncbi:DUF5107 domain-containing protein [Xylanibacter muris]|uniref:DUF5107 domain-containing protein n=1 Tax=Xylanibacter muris TaxID=2736290 RepID=A0ABX2AJJ5_9BACT|nr:DUF5107 domain-containing protein [Xylanibacter muris]NPD91321.1 DUF5107 domain-containing protein [Xylanibacter muris]